MAVYLMKRMLVLLLIVLMFGFVVAQDMPDAGIGGEDVEKIKGVIENYSPLDESGEVDFEKYAPFKTKAEIRIEAINLWLEENASWLKVVFGMVPSISWLFAFNLYLLLFFFMMLILNGNVFDLGISDKKFDFFFFEGTWGNILGAVVFVILDVTKIIASLARFSYHSWDIIWNYILPWGFAVAVIIAIAAAIGFVLLLIYAPGVLVKLGEMIEARKKKKAAEKEAVNREVLEKTVEGMTEK